MNHAKEGSGKRRREQENDQFSRGLALSLIWSGSLGFNSMSQSGLETHTFVITFQEEGAGRWEFSGVIKRGRLGIISRRRDCLALALHSIPNTWMLSVKTDHCLLLHRLERGQGHVGGDFGSCLTLPSWLRAVRTTKGSKIASSQYHCGLGLGQNGGSRSWNYLWFCHVFSQREQRLYLYRSKSAGYLLTFPINAFFVACLSLLGHELLWLVFLDTKVPVLKRM